MGNFIDQLKSDKLTLTLNVVEEACEIVIYLILHNSDITVNKSGPVFKENPGSYLLMVRSSGFMVELSFAFWFTTALTLIVGCSYTQNRRDNISQVFFVFLYHTSGTILFLITSILLLMGSNIFKTGNSSFIFAGALGVIVSFLHGLRSYPSFSIWNERRKELTGKGWPWSSSSGRSADDGDQQTTGSKGGGGGWFGS